MRRLVGGKGRVPERRLTHKQEINELSPVIIFDWDDTLFPTSYLLKEVAPALRRRRPRLPSADHRGNLDGATGGQRRFRKDSDASEATVNLPEPYHSDLAEHAKVIRFVLRTARSLANVGIVTLAKEPWVVDSGKYLPGLDLEHLLEELDIPVYYAGDMIATPGQPRYSRKWAVKLDRSAGGILGIEVDHTMDGSLLISRIGEGLMTAWNEANPKAEVVPGDRIVEVNGATKNLLKECKKECVLKILVGRVQTERYDPLTVAKRTAMLQCLSRLHPNKEKLLNVVSVGDSIKEQDAIKDLLQGKGRPYQKSLCKTVHLIDAPTVEVLGNELRLLMVSLPRIIARESHFDLRMDNLSDEEEDIFRNSDA